jgi:hypothetical protein
LGEQMGFFKKIRQALGRFMQGRYGNDKLNMALLTVGAVGCLLNILIPLGIFNLLFMLLWYGLMIFVIFRMLSRNTYKRYRENRKYLQFVEKLKDREHRYYDCPRCRQQVRVPRGKGKIAISCPKCKEKFVKKT